MKGERPGHMAQPKAQIGVDAEDQQGGHDPESLTVPAIDGEGDASGEPVFFMIYDLRMPATGRQRQTLRGEAITHTQVKNRPEDAPERVLPPVEAPSLQP
jgi:hypothetical protein